MEFFTAILSVLDTKMSTPVPYGPFHIAFILASVYAGFRIAKLCTNQDASFIRHFLLSVSLLCMVLELYKQVNFSFHLDGRQVIFDYQWYAFPFQFCSTPMYIGLAAAITKKESLHQRLCSYLASYSLFAGICVMVYPVTVFIDTVGINIQTMVCHGSMITMGIVLLRSGYIRVSTQTITRAIPVFLALVLAAVVMNEAAYQCGLLDTETFNMFFISPYCSPELPVYSLIQGIVQFPFSVMIYIAGFTAAASAVLLFCKVVGLVAATHRHNKPQARLHRLPAIH